MTLAVFASLVAAACGSTASRQDHSTASRQDQQATSSELELSDGRKGPNNGRASTVDDDADPFSPAPDARPSLDTDAPDPGDLSKPVGGRADVEPAGSQVMGPGITDDTITIGITWWDINAVVAAVAPNSDTQASDTTKDAAEAIVRWINSHGGIAGRQIDPVYHEFPVADLATSSSRAAREQAMCADFAEDHRAFAAFPYLSSEVFHRCAAQHNLVTIANRDSTEPVDRTEFDSIGHVYYRPAGFLADRRDEMFVAQLDRRRFFTPEAKVGLILWDNPSSRRAAQRSLEPALEALGVEVVARDYFKELYHSWENTVLRFRSAGVTHVIWGSSGCQNICTGQFMTTSESQRYRPFNAIGSEHGTRLALIPEGQREQLVVIGWAPPDVDDAYATAAPINDNDALCRQIRQESGIEVPQAFVANYCDALFFIKQAVEGASELTAEGFRQAVEARAFKYPAVTTWATMFGPGRHDGTSGVRDVVYEPECECLRFAGPVREVG